MQNIVARVFSEVIGRTRIRVLHLDGVGSSVVGLQREGLIISPHLQAFS